MKRRSFLKGLAGVTVLAVPKPGEEKLVGVEIGEIVVDEMQDIKPFPKGPFAPGEVQIYSKGFSVQGSLPATSFHDMALRLQEIESTRLREYVDQMCKGSGVRIKGATPCDDDHS